MEEIKTDDEAEEPNQLTQGSSRRVEINDELDVLAEEFANRKGFEGYFKTSALFGTNVKNVFDEAIFTVNQIRCE